MFAALAQGISATLRRLSGQGVLTEEDIREGLREIRRWLIEADVSFEVAREFTERVRAKAVGVPHLKTVRPGQQLAKIVHDELVVLLGGQPVPLRFASVPPTVILLVGLQGSGKTTTAAKLAFRLKREQKAPLLVAADPYRPAAEEQLRQLGERIGVPVFGPADAAGKSARGAAAGAGAASLDVVGVTRSAMSAASRLRARTVIVDTAGRTQLEAEMMSELVRLRDAVRPHEVLLVADSMTGQDAVRIARGFHQVVGLTGVILTKLDGDARGGAALSIREVTGAPIKFLGTGEGMEALELLDPVRLAGRILGQGDVVALVERAQEAVDQETAERLARRAASKQGMDLDDLLQALRRVRAMGPLDQLAGMLPGMGGRVVQQAAARDPRQVKHAEAILLSMTPEERRRPEVLNGSRRARIARGSGRPVQEVNALLKQFEEVQRLLRQVGRMGRRR